MTQKRTHLLEMVTIDTLNTNASPAPGDPTMTQRRQLRTDVLILSVEGEHQML